MLFFIVINYISGIGDDGNFGSASLS